MYQWLPWSIDVQCAAAVALKDLYGFQSLWDADLYSDSIAQCSQPVHDANIFTQFPLENAIVASTQRGR